MDVDVQQDEIWVVEYKVSFQDGTKHWWRIPEMFTSQESANIATKRISYLEYRVRLFVPSFFFPHKND